MERSVCFLLCVTLTSTLATSASAHETAICAEAASKAQSLRDDQKLLEAQRQFQVCARQECPALIRQDCSTWLGEVQPRVPTLALSAVDGSGAALFEVRVTANEQLLAQRLDGREISLDPGRYALAFYASDGTKVTEDVVLSQGEHKAVAVRFPGPHAFPWKTVGYVAGGLGIAGLVVGAGAGLAALSAKNRANCDDEHQCDAGPLAEARRNANLATVGFVAGGVLLAAGAGVILWAGHQRGASVGEWQAAPLLGANGGGLLLQRQW